MYGFEEEKKTYDICLGKLCWIVKNLEEKKKNIRMDMVHVIVYIDRKIGWILQWEWYFDIKEIAEIRQKANKKGKCKEYWRSMNTLVFLNQKQFPNFQEFLFNCIPALVYLKFQFLKLTFDERHRFRSKNLTSCHEKYFS